jgi:hypothetical protein
MCVKMELMLSPLHRWGIENYLLLHVIK